MKVSNFKAVIISSSKTVESVSTIVIKDDGTAVAHGFGHIIDFDYQEFSDHGYCKGKINSYEYAHVFMLNEYLYAKLIDVFDKDNANRIISNFFTQIEWDKALEDDNVTSAIMLMFYASLYKTANELENIQEETGSKLVHTRDFKLGLTINE